MRKITEDAISAFLSRRPFSRSNTRVVAVKNGLCKLLLHDNTIAVLNIDNTLTITNASWKTATTKERLNGIPGVSIHQKAFKWFLNGNPWDGRWTTIKKRRVL